MAITERSLPGGKWERTFTGPDIEKAKGSLTKVANEAYKKAFHENERKYVKVTAPDGGITDVHERDLETALANGYGMAPRAPSMVVPELPWEPKRFGPGKHKWRYNRETREMEAV